MDRSLEILKAVELVNENQKLVIPDKDQVPFWK